MEPDERAALARSYWRRQLVLTAAAAVAVVVCCGLVALSVSLVHVWPAMLAVVLTVAMLTVTVVHAARVAAFTFRRGD